VSSYTITITPDDHARATTTLRVEVTDTAARVTELLVRAGDGDGLTAAQLPAVDLDQLLRAVIPTTSVPVAITATAQPSPETSTSEATTEQPEATAAPVAAPQPAPEAEPATRQPLKATTNPRPRGAATGAGKTAKAGAKRSTRGNAATKATKAARRSQASKAVSSAKRTAAEKTATPASAKGGRAYRRSPDDLAAVYQQAGTAAAIADHYGVPRHTAQGWIRTLRRSSTAAVSE
jgi:hypothetical protein